MELNFTLFLQAGIYLAAFFILKHLYFKPILAALKRREQLTTGRAHESDELVLRLGDLKASYESKIREVKIDLENKRQEALKKVRDNSEDQIRRAKEISEKNQSNHLENLERESKLIRSKFAALSSDLRKEIISAMTASRVVNL